MKFSIILFLFSIQVSISQISITSDASIDRVQKEYDSLYNFPGKEYKSLKNQFLYLKPKTESLRKYGYGDFKLNPKITGDPYKPGVSNSHNSDYEYMESKIFKVIDFVQDSYRIYFHLEDTISKKKLYYHYNERLKSSFPFVVMGFFEKQKGNIGNTVYLKDGFTVNFVDAENGSEIAIKPEDERQWIVKDLTIHGKYYELSYILQSGYTKTSISVESFDKAAYFEDDYNDIKKSYPDFYLDIMAGSVRIGMSKKAVIESWGNPSKKNVSSYNEQWVYPSNYLYFEDDVLRSFN